VDRRVLFVLLVAALCPYFVGLGDSSIWDANEAFYVETPREMMERGDYVRPTFNYEPRLNKPVLSYWIVAAFYSLFGVSIGVQRLAIALGAVLLIAAAFALGRAAAEPRGAGGSATPTALDAGLWAALGLAIAPRLVMFARRIFIDIYTSAFMGLTLAFFALSERYPERRRSFLVLMYVAVGIGTLTKGPVALALPGLVFAVYLLAYRELSRVGQMMIPLGILIVSAIVVPWYVALYLRGDGQYILTFLLGENIGRFAEGMGESARRGPLFYVPVVFSDSFPWSLLLVPAAVDWWRGRRGGAAATGPRRVRALLWLWILVIVVFFSLSQTKQDLYIFPIVVAIAALGGVVVVDRGASSVDAPLRFTIAALGALLLIGGVAAWYWLHGLATSYGLDGMALAFTIAAAGGAATLVSVAARRSVHGLVLLIAAIIAVNWVFILRVLPSVEPYKPSPAFARVIAERAGPDDLVAHFNIAMPSMVFYLQRHIDVYYDLEAFSTALRGGRDVYAVLWAADYAAVRAQSGVETCVVDRRPTLEAKLRDFLARAPLPEVLLVSTDCR
jgi:4-amino-4-deoxy-L-arabinose transferase-like glycosyltransferase